VSGLLPPEIEAQFDAFEAERLATAQRWLELWARRPAGATVVYHYVNGEPDQGRGQIDMEGSR
jgi:hypothetical protein